MLAAKKGGSMGKSEERVQKVPLGDLEIWAGQPRKSYTGIAELGVSLVTQGQIEPLIVRPKKGSPGKYEVGVGARRFLAAKGEDLLFLLCIVRELDDATMFDMGTAENVARQSMTPMEEADAFAAMELRLGTADLAFKVGLSERAVRQRLVLARLCTLGRRALEEGDIEVGAAQLIARLPAVALQEQLLTEIARIRKADAYEAGQPLDTATVRAIVESRYLTRLDGARWSKKLPMLLADGSELPACSTCPSRTGNQPELFDDVSSPDVCTDAICFGKKKARHNEQLECELRAKGAQVLEGEEARKVLHYSGAVAASSGYVDLDAPAPGDASGRSFRAILGKNAPSPTMAAKDEGGAVHALATREAMLEALAARGDEAHEKALREQGEEAKKGPDPEAHAKEVQEAKVRRLAVDESMGALLVSVVKGGISKRPEVFLEVVIAGLLAVTWSKVLEEIARRRGVLFGKVAAKEQKLAKGKPGPTVQEALADHVEGATLPEQQAFVLELAIAQNVYARERPAPFALALERYGVDFKKHHAAAKKSVAKGTPSSSRQSGKRAKKEAASEDEEEDRGPCCDVTKLFPGGNALAGRPELSDLAYVTNQVRACPACTALGEQLEEVIAEGFLAAPVVTLLVEHLVEGGEGVVGEHEERRVQEVLAWKEAAGRVWTDGKGVLHTYRRALKKRYEVNGAVRRRVG